jgi:YesN/AraC family two-component response regulator
MANILIIDDEELVRLTLQQILEEAGHVVREAADGAEGIRLYQESPADLVVTDIIMPDTEGIETIIQLRKHDPAVNIIAISGGGRVRNLDFLDVAEKFGAARVLAKPFEEEELLEAVDECLGQTAAAQGTPA